MAKTDEITAILEGTNPPASNQHQNWLNRNLDTSASFMGVPIAGGVCRAMQPALRSAEGALRQIGTAATLGIRSISGFQGGGFHGYHSWGLAVDINYTTNPYIMNEHGEGVLDRQLGPVFNRICHLMIVDDPQHPDKDSIVPRLGELRRTRRLQEAYDAIRVESDAMKSYFTLMQDGNALKNYLNTPAGYKGYVAAFGAEGADPAAVLTPRTPTPPTQTLIPNALAVQHQMEADWTVLTSREIPAVQDPPSNAIACYPDLLFQSAAPIPRGDRPFDGPGGQSLLKGRSPLAGYLDLSPELVRALVTANLRWGATDFGAESGDIMHFDCGNQSGLNFPTGRTVGDLQRAIGVWNRAHP
jgi:hypothetical protein